MSDFVTVLSGKTEKNVIFKLKLVFGAANFIFC